MDFRILGSLEVWDGERQLELGGTKRRAVLAFLLLHPNEVVGVDRLIDQLWGDRTPRNAAAALRTHVSRLRKELGAEVVATRTWGYVLRTEPDTIDLHRFERLVAGAENLPARERAEKLREALALWRGAPLEDIAFEPALAKDIARLEELHLTVLENRIDADLEAGNHNGLVGELETLLAAHPLRERPRGQLILTLYRSGRQAEALEVYRETRRVLVDKLGIEPSPELRELERAILQHDPALQPAVAALVPAGVPTTRPGRRRRIYLGASAAALFIGLGAVTAYAVAARNSGEARSAGPPTETFVTLSPFVSVSSQRHARRDRPQKATRHARSGQQKHATTTVRTSTTARTHRGQRGTPTSRKPSSKPRPVRISDSFSDSTLDPLTWNSWSNGTGTSLAEEDGRLVFSIAGDATFDPQFHGAASNIGTNCKFPGDFDARVDFSLGQWPPANGAAISLIAYGASLEELIQRFTAPWGDGYNAYPTGTSAKPLADQSGTLRMTRRHGVVRVYFSHDGRWREIGRAPLTGAVSVWISVGTFQKYWQGQDVSAAVDNFRLTASNASCPTGSDPRNP